MFKGLVMGAGAVVAAAALPAAARRWGPKGPEIVDARPLTFWEKDAGPLPETGTVDADMNVDVAIIGSGITGLSAALAWKGSRPGDKVLVLDSHRPISGASTRNSGLLIGEYHTWQSILAKRGPQAAQEWNAFSRRGLEALITFIKTNNIECDLRQAPLLTVGTATQARAVEALAQLRTEAGLEAALLKGPALSERTKTGFYAAAVEVAGGWLMHPGKLMKGVLQTALAAGVLVRGNSPVMELSAAESKNNANTLVTPGGTVTARYVLVTANAYTPRLNGLLSSRLLPIHVAVVATRPLTEAERDRAGFLCADLKEIQTLSRTIGITPDQRVFLRGIFGYRAFNSGVWPADGSYQRLERELRARLPYLEGIEITERWSGPVAMTINGTPLAGRIPQSNAYVCAGYNGVGMVDGFHHGRLVVHQMLGADHPDLKYLKAPSSAGWIPPEPYRSIGIKTFFRLSL